MLAKPNLRIALHIPSCAARLGQSAEALFHPAYQAPAQQKLHLSRRHTVTHLEFDLACDVFDYQFIPLCQHASQIGQAHYVAGLDTVVVRRIDEGQR